MKQKIRALAEYIFTIKIIRGLIRSIINLNKLTSRAWSFIRVRALLEVPAGSSAHWSTEYKYPQNITLLGRVMISPDCVLGARSPISIGNEVRLSQGVHIETASLDLKSGLPYKHISKPIVIGDGVWIGAHSIILGGVTIGANSIIGAGVTVSKNVPENSILVGAPTRNINLKETYHQ